MKSFAWIASKAGAAVVAGTLMANEHLMTANATCGSCGGEPTYRVCEAGYSMYECSTHPYNPPNTPGEGHTFCMYEQNNWCWYILCLSEGNPEQYCYAIMS
jgi:hypothetical protein